jgi:hypothetical protein
MTDHPAKTIYVQPTETPLGLLNRIGHEVGHVLLHPGGWGGPKWTQEVEAQGFAWQLLARWGSEVSDYSCTYILGWSEGRAVEELVFGARVQAALRELEREIGGAGMEAVDVEVGGMR